MTSQHDLTENKRISYWLEKLHIQGEKVRKNSNRRDELERLPLNEPFPPEQVSSNKDARQIGKNENLKNSAIKSEIDKTIVNDLVRKSNRLIMSISSTFPWELFPNSIDVEESRVTFTFSQFLTSQSHSVDIKDISNVFIESSWFFSTLQVVSRTYIQNDIKIGNLNKTKAKQVQKIIEGLRTFSANDINTSSYEIDELVSKIGEFHTSH